MVAGHLQEKNGYYYIVLNFRDEMNRRKPKWVSTGLEVKKGNKKKAEKKLMEERQKYSVAQRNASQDMLFADYMKDIQAWLGNSTYNTTAEFYAHLDAASKDNTGAAMAEAMDISGALIAVQG